MYGKRDKFELAKANAENRSSGISTEAKKIIWFSASVCISDFIVVLYATELGVIFCEYLLLWL